MERIYPARDAMEAHFVRGLLQAEGIDAVVLGESLGMARGELPMTQQTLPSVWVKPEDVSRAETVVESFRHCTPHSGFGGGFEVIVPQAREQQAEWTCPRCGEKLEPQFTDCWNCGRGRIDTASQGQP